MDRLERTSKKSPAPQGVSRRRRQREKRYLPSHLLGDGDRGRIRAPAKSCGQDNATCSQTKAGCSILPPQAPQSLLLMQASMPDPRSALHRIGFLAADGAVEGVDQGLDFGEFDAGPLGLVAIERSGEHLGMRVPVFDHPLAGFLQRLKSLAHFRLLLSYPHPATRPKSSVKGRRKPAIAEDHGRFIVIAPSRPRLGMFDG